MGRQHSKTVVERLTQAMVLGKYLEEDSVELSSGFAANYVNVRARVLPLSVLSCLSVGRRLSYLSLSLSLLHTTTHNPPLPPPTNNEKSSWAPRRRI